MILSIASRSETRRDRHDRVQVIDFMQQRVSARSRVKSVTRQARHRRDAEHRSARASWYETVVAVRVVEPRY